MDLEFADGAVFDFADMGSPGDGELVNAVAAVDNPGFGRAERSERFGHGPRPLGGEDAEYLELRTRRIGERAEQVEDGADAELGPHGRDMAHGAVMGAGEHEGDTGAIEAGLEFALVGFKVHAERFEHVGRAGLGRHGPVTMLGDAATRSGDDERAGGGRVEALPWQAARAACIKYRALDMHLAGMLAHDARACGQLGGRLAAHREASQESADLFRRGFARQQEFERGFQRVAFQRLIAGDGLDGRGEGSVSHQ